VLILLLVLFPFLCYATHGSFPLLETRTRIKQEWLHRLRETMDQDEDRLLVQLMTNVDRSFETLMTIYWPQLYAFVFRRTARQHDAEDIASEAFVRAYVALKGYPVERIRTLKLRPWLYKITYHEYCRYIGKSSEPAVSLAYFEEGAAMEQEDEQQPESIFESVERRLELESLVATLPERYREAISLYYFEDLSYQEIADLLEQPIGTVKSSVHRGLRLLRMKSSAQPGQVY
jgi:RNA polymerase sigma-70 factor, ECF subfamily